MIPITINFGSLPKELDLTIAETEGLMENVVKELTASMVHLWDAEAKNTLSSTRQEYRSSLTVVDKGRFEGMVILRGQLANMIENGAGAFDMKPGFMGSPFAKSTEGGGWYFTIPFRFATPGALGESSVFSDILPESIYNVLKTKPPGGRIEEGDIDIPDALRVPKTRKMIVTKSRVFEEYKAKTSTYVGIGRSDKTYAKTTQSTFTSFRRVSDKSDPNAWIHRGIKARNLAEKALEKLNVGRTVDKLTDNYLSSIGL